MPAWPGFMPEPIFDSISEGAPIGGAIRTQMEVGPVKQRPRSTAVVYPLTFSVEPLKAADIGAFRNFFVNDLAMGSLSFEMDHPVTDEPSNFRFNLDEEAWSYRPIGKDAYRLNVVLELLP